MCLSPHPTYPAAGSYVVRLHRDARPEAGLLVGRAEHVASGACTDFASAEQLCAWLARQAAQVPPWTNVDIGAAGRPSHPGETS